MSAVVIDTPEGVSFARLAALKGALKLEVIGLKRRGRSAYSILKSDYGYRGSRESVLKQVTEDIEQELRTREAEIMKEQTF